MLGRIVFETLLVGAAASLRGGAAETPPSSPLIRRIDEMTSREVEFYQKQGGDLVFVPFGPVSGHGALIPMGMHAHWATAVSVLLAEKANGLVFPTTFACFAGAMRTFRGTVSFLIEEQVSVLKRVASTLHAAGFKRTVLVAGTNPEDTGGIIAARALYDETETHTGICKAHASSTLRKSRRCTRAILPISLRHSSNSPASESWGASVPPAGAVGARAQGGGRATNRPRSRKTSGKRNNSAPSVDVTSRKKISEITARRESCS